VRGFVLFPDYLSSEVHLLGGEESVLSSIWETNKHVKDAMALSPPLEPGDDYTQAETKMRRALSRLKRAAIKFVDHPDDMKSLGDGIVGAVKTLLMDIATTMEALLSTVCTARAPAIHISSLPPPCSGI
jgi:hypothetical protein